MATSKDVVTDSNDIVQVVIAAFKMIQKSWAAFKINLPAFVFLMILPLFGALLAAIGFVGLIAGDSSLISILLAVTIFTAIVIIALILAPAVVYLQLQSAKGKEVHFVTAFKQSASLVLPFAGLIILSAIAISIGLVLLVIPGILAAFFLSMSAYILVDKRLGIIESMKASYELTKANWQWIIAIITVQIAISAVQYVPLVGWIANIALSIAYFCLPAIIYLKISKKS